jgi:hypothetical protein
MNQGRKLYRFSPINETKVLLEAVDYVSKEATKMLFRNQGYALPIEYVTIFSHYEDEYNELVKLSSELGLQSQTNNGVKIELINPLESFAMSLDVNGEREDVTHLIKAIRIRKPDPYRMQVGCCDFEYGLDYTWLSTTETLANHNVRHIEREDIDMVEFYDPDFDILGYVVQQ